MLKVTYPRKCVMASYHDRSVYGSARRPEVKTKWLIRDSHDFVVKHNRDAVIFRKLS